MRDVISGCACVVVRFIKIR